jgi:hypothetical protein
MKFLAYARLGPGPSSAEVMSERKQRVERGWPHLLTTVQAPVAQHAFVLLRAHLCFLCAINQSAACKEWRERG